MNEGMAARCLRHILQAYIRQRFVLVVQIADLLKALLTKAGGTTLFRVQVGQSGMGAVGAGSCRTQPRVLVTVVVEKQQRVLTMPPRTR